MSFSVSESGKVTLSEQVTVLDRGVSEGSIICNFSSETTPGLNTVQMSCTCVHRMQECRLLNGTPPERGWWHRSGTSWLPNQSATFSWRSFTWQQSPHCYPHRWGSLATTRGKYASAIFFHINRCLLEYVSVQICVSVSERDSGHAYFNIHDCRDTKKAIEGIKDLVLSRTGI